MKTKLNEQKRIFKIPSELLRKNAWKLELPLEEAVKNQPELLVTIGDSQLLRWIDELNGVTDYNDIVANLKQKLNRLKTKKDSGKNRAKRKELIAQLYQTEFQADYVCVIMNTLRDYDRANKGFMINGIKYKRLLGTNGGIKNSTIVYINEEKISEIKRRIDNGRNKNIPLVPAKLEAYQALVCSGSTPIPMPEGVIVVKDCITNFSENVISIRDGEENDEPILTHIDDYNFDHNNSDGCGLMSPAYASKISEALTSQSDPLSGMIIRYAWTKGMLCTFDFVEFAEQVADTYEIVDVWGTKRDVRNAEVILTESMLKLWDSYDSWEDFYRNCQENQYQFAVTKVCPFDLEAERTTNYQFLQSYEFNGEEIQQLCKPTIDEIFDIMGFDYRKSILFMAGTNLNEETIELIDDNFVKALMIEPKMINDPFVKSEIYANIKKRIERAKKGKLNVSGNYQMVVGDPYALAQSMFSLPITGLLSAGELYSHYWLVKGAEAVGCFRAPMSCANNIVKMAVRDDTVTAKWYQYIKTAIIINAWDSTAEALNGCDFDGDCFFTTDNDILVNNIKDLPTIVCQQKRAEKKLPTEADLIAANKIAFNDEIGKITNRVTAMFERLAKFDADSPEAEVLKYRIMCGQHYQQCAIDSAKGIISKPMPKEWYTSRYIDLTDLEAATVADRKPYFMSYVYPNQRKLFRDFVSQADQKSVFNFGISVDDLQRLENPTAQQQEFIDDYKRYLPLGIEDCTINRICFYIEKVFKNIPPFTSDTPFDIDLLKCHKAYTRQQYAKIERIYSDYERRVIDFKAMADKCKLDKEDVQMTYTSMISDYQRRCAIEVPDDEALVDILIDMLYTSNKSKAFVWLVCGSQLIKNLLKKNGNKISYPIKSENGDFEFNGEKYVMQTMEVLQ